MKTKFLLITLILTSMVGCTLSPSANNQQPTPAASQTAQTNQPVVAKETATSNKPENTTQNAQQSAKASTTCGPFTLPGKIFIKDQSFSFNAAPFPNSCFVTFGDKEQMLNEKDVPRGSKFYIFKDGKQVFEFPDGFSSDGCWIDAASFTDLNGDGLTDVIIAGSCLAAKDSYPSNAVYVNTGKGFTTNSEANAKLDEFGKAKEIEGFVRKNVKLFF